VTTAERRTPAPEQGADVPDEHRVTINNTPGVAQRPAVELALACDANGWQVFPVRIEPDGDGDKTRKIPLVKWKEGATSEEREVRRLWRQFPEAAVGIKTGRDSGLYVVDVDRPERADELGLPLVLGREVPTNRPGGRHVYFSGPVDGKPVRNTTDNGVDHRGDGGFVVCWHRVPAGTLSPLPPEVAEWARGGRSESGPADPIPEVITEGGRESALVSMAGTMRRRGASETVILAALREMNEAQCVPPLPDEDLERIAGSVMRYEPDETPRGAALLNAVLQGRHNTRSLASDDLTMQDLTDMCAEALQHRAVWREDLQQWWLCSQTSRPGIWSKEYARGVDKEVTRLVREVMPKATRSYVEQILRDLKNPLVVKGQDEFDTDPWMLGVINGVVDLRTGRLMEGDPALRLTRSTAVPYIPGAPCPRWLAHLDRLFEGDPERVGWFQMAIGAALVGDSNDKDQVFVYLVGPEGSGKSAAIRMLTEAMGDYVAIISPMHLTLTNRERHTSWLWALAGARLAMVEEVRSDRLDVSQLKNLTGGGRLRAQTGMGKDFVDWAPTHSIFMAANQAPDFDNDTSGMDRRYRPIPTGPTLTAEELAANEGWEQSIIRDELPGILAWAIEGCLKWQEQPGRRLPELESMAQVKRDHLELADPTGQWIAERVVACDQRASRGQVYQAYMTWCIAAGVSPVSSKALYARMRQAGHRDQKTNGERVFGVLLA